MTRCAEFSEKSVCGAKFVIGFPFRSEVFRESSAAFMQMGLEYAGASRLNELVRFLERLESAGFLA